MFEIDRRTLLAGTASIFAFSSVSALAEDGGPLVQTASGKLRGRVEGAANVFRGIPYALPPIGARRFQAPMPPSKWIGVRDALSYGPMSFQRAVSDYDYIEQLPGIYPSPNYPMSEDCLYLNVWSPTLDKSAKLPVMVWLHPGGVVMGAGNSPWCDGNNLATRGDVVVVTVTHRLSIFGFLYLAHLSDKFPDSSNAGLLDIVAALRWVSENIAEFGGDPSRVTIFGESGGAMKVSMLMGMPAAKGLFHRAVAQSFSVSRGETIEKASVHTARVIASLGLNEKTINSIVDLSPYALLEADNFGPAMPITDGRIIPEHPFSPHASPISADVPMLIGFNKNDGAYGAYAEDRVKIRNDVDFIKYVEANGWAGPKEVDLARRKLEVYHSLYSETSPEFMQDTLETWQRWGECVVQAEAKIAQNRAPVYMYRFDWSSPVQRGRYGSSHAFEIPFVFDNMDVTPEFFGNPPDPRRYEVAENVSKCWAAFAHGANPSHPGMPRWSPYTLANRETMILGYECQFVDDPESEVRRKLEPIWQEGALLDWDFHR